MSLTYDQKSEIRMAFDEAFVPPERRRDFRLKHRVEAQICPWHKNCQGEPFTVQIEDFSPGGVGLSHAEPLAVGSEYLLRVPRPDMDELVVLLSVVRCRPMEDGTFHVGMELSSVMDRTSLGQLIDALQTRPRRSRWKLFFMLFGIVGIGSAVFL
jgi:c-di-GMP-binding flagellar brake protein YcgR